VKYLHRLPSELRVSQAELYRAMLAVVLVQDEQAEELERQRREAER
jgi:hypothetical protein